MHICVKFHKNPISRLGGVALTRYMDGEQTDVWTDGQGDSYIPPPPNFVCGGYKYSQVGSKKGAILVENFKDI